MAYQRGVFASGGTWGAIQDFSQDNGGEREEVMDASGNVTDLDHFNRTADVTFDVVFTVGSTIPDYGATFTVTGATENNGLFFCDGTTETQNNKTHTRFNIKGKRYLENGLPAA